MIEQGSQEWIEARLGRVTASRLADAVARTKTGWGASRSNYMADLIAERLTGVQCATFTNRAMQHGTETEPEAKSAYEFRVDCDVAPCGFVGHPKIAMSGASPDGFIADDGLVEIKCPNTATHIDTLLGSSIDGKYLKQMQWQMACCERAWCDFVSYDPRLPPAMQLFIKRVHRDEKLIGDLERDVTIFLEELDMKLKALTTRYCEGKDPLKVSLAASLISHDAMMVQLQEPASWQT